MINFIIISFLCGGSGRVDFKSSFIGYLLQAASSLSLSLLFHCYKHAFDGYGLWALLKASEKLNVFTLSSLF